MFMQKCRLTQRFREIALAAWRSVHRVGLTNRSSGFESRQGFKGKHSNAVVLIDFIRNLWLIYSEYNLPHI
jgi:hypothetical protein